MRDDESRPRDEQGKPNPVMAAVSGAVAALRADDDMLALAKAYMSLEPKLIEKLDVAGARRQPTTADAVNVLLRQQGRSTEPEQRVPGVRTHELAIDGAAGPLPAIVYTPEAAGPLPVVLYFHGGGWVIGSRTVYDSSTRGLARRSGAIVVSVDYRLAPEHPFPAAWDDALAAYRWLSVHAASIGGDPARLALAGESAGGTLAVATAVAARAAGLPGPRHVLTVYPLTQTRLLTESYIENAIARPLSRATVKWFLHQLVQTESALRDTRLQLIEADLAGLPSVSIVSASLDPLRSDGAKLEDALNTAGVPVERRVYDGVGHDFFGAADVLEKARRAQAFAGDRLRAALA